MIGLLLLACTGDPVPPDDTGSRVTGVTDADGDGFAVDEDRTVLTLPGAA